MTHDFLLTKIADYILDDRLPSAHAMHMASFCLADAMGCAIASLQFKECSRLLMPWVPGTKVPDGCRIPGLKDTFDPVMGAFVLGSMIRWLDYNDTFLAKEWAHPSDNIGGLLPLMDYLSQTKSPLKVRDLLIAMIKAYEIQGGLSLENSFNQIGYDHVILVKFATTALAAHLLGGSKQQIMDALSQSIVDAGPLRTYRHAPNVGSRKSWAAGDAASRAVALAMLTMRGEKGYETPLSAPRWGLDTVLFPLKLTLPLGSTIIENILFKIAFPAEFHAQTAVEAALKARKLINNVEDIEKIEILTHKAALDIIDKKGPLKNYADRDHCMQYMVAVALLYGELKAEHYQDETASDPRIDILREKMILKESVDFSKDYHHPDLRAISNALTVYLKDQSVIGPLLVEFPLGHKKRREESIPLLFEKLKKNLGTHFKAPQVNRILKTFQEQKELEELPIPQFIELFFQK